MELINIDAIPSQQFTVPLGGNNYDIKIYSIEGHMSYDLSVNAVNIIQGFKIVNDIPLLPYPHQEINGNLLLSLSIDEIPNYELFGTSQFLYYLTDEEITQCRAANNL